MNKIFTKAAMAVSIAAASFTSFLVSAETANVVASVQVKNTFDFAAGDPMNFGVIRVTNGGDAADFASVILPPLAGSNPGYIATAGTTNTDAVISVLDSTDFAPATFTISGASNFTDIVIQTIADVTMTTQDAAPGGPGFTLSDFKYYVVDGTNDGDTGEIDGSASIVTTDIDGAATFSVGATLTTDKAVFTQYGDVAYTGDVAVTVEYQ